MSDSTIEQERIEEDLRATRSRMDQRLDQLQGKLAPGQIFEDLLDYMRGNGGGEFGHKLLDSVQKNPLPAVVAGVGLAWLMASDFRPMPTVVTAPASNGGYPYGGGSYDLQQRLRDAESGVQRDAGDTDDSYASRMDDARGAVLGVARQAQDTASSFAQRVQAAMASAKESATRNTHDLRDRASGVAGQMSDSAQQFGGRLSDSAQQLGGQVAQGAKAAQQSGSDALAALTANPLALGALGLAAGALLGVLLPHTAQEEAALGNIAGQARDTARTVAQSVVDQGANVAQKVLDAAKDSAATHGLTTDKSLDEVVSDLKSGNIVDNVKNVAQDVLNASEQALKKGNGQDANHA